MQLATTKTCKAQALELIEPTPQAGGAKRDSSLYRCIAVVSICSYDSSAFSIPEAEAPNGKCEGSRAYCCQLQGLGVQHSHQIAAHITHAKLKHSSVRHALLHHTRPV